MTPEELDRRIRLIHEPHLSTRHAIDAFIQAQGNLPVQRSSFRAFLNAGAEFTWTMKAQLQEVAGGAGPYVEWWDSAAVHLKSDPIGSFLWGLRPKAAHEGVLHTETQLVSDMSLEEAEAHAEAGAWGIAFGVETWVYITGTPAPYEAYPAVSLMVHWRNLMTEVLFHAVLRFAPHMPHLDRQSGRPVDTSKIAAQMRRKCALGPQLPAFKETGGPRGGIVLGRD